MPGASPDRKTVSIGLCIVAYAAQFLRLDSMHTAAVLGSGVSGADEKRVAQVMGAIADRVTDQFVNPYTFPSTHKRILEPYNYYDFGQVRTIKVSCSSRTEGPSPSWQSLLCQKKWQHPPRSLPLQALWGSARRPAELFESLIAS